MENFLAGLSAQQRDAMAFLFTHLPPSDLDTYDRSLFLSFVDHALALRQNAPWCAALDEELFYHYVLFPRVNDEDLSFHREIFRAALWERIKDLSTPEEMALEVNRWCHEHASYEMQDDRTASPLTVYHAGSGRCGEESGFLVAALRSIGLPARQVYSPRWAHCDDNHAWVEVLCNGTWRFLGACEPEPILDRGWFNAPASRALLVHSRIFGEGSHPLHGEKISTGQCVTWFNQTRRYALTEHKTLRATVNGKPAEGATFYIQVLNEASFHTIATLTADTHGEASIALGLGDIHIFAVLGDYSAECDCHAGEDAVLSLEVFHDQHTDWWKIDYIAPLDAPVNPAPLTDAQKQERARTLARGNNLRTARIAAMCPDSSYPLLSSARGNATHIQQFLTHDDHTLRETLLRTLTAKDLRDVDVRLLEQHLRAVSPKNDTDPDEIYRLYVLCPRIGLEPLSSWQTELPGHFTKDELLLLRSAPEQTETVLRQKLIPVETYQGLIWPPAAALAAGRCDERSFRILCVAVLRSLGIPARLASMDGQPEYWLDGQWHRTASDNTGTLLLTSDHPPLYRQNYTISRREKNGWKLLHPDEFGWHDGRCTLSLPAGLYRIITSVRMPNGNQFAALREFEIMANTETGISLLFRSYELSDLLRCQQLPVMKAVTPGGENTENICQINDRPSLLFWLEEGGEPTEHILNELLSARETMTALPINLIFLLRNRESLVQRTLTAVLAAMPDIYVFFDDWTYDLEQVARHLTCDPDRPPLAVVCDREGHAIYGTSGYSVGSVELLARIAAYIANE